MTVGLAHLQALGATTAARLLFDAGAEPDATDMKGRPALAHAASCGQRETALMLVCACERVVRMQR